ncbi:MAG: PQQ-dependent sugar dehydrogenase [Hyphomicrobiales bacterium]|nr:PQQ-dependent sugar dehydrogenase [Hyphomicrobiales bacterium]
MRKSVSAIAMALAGGMAAASSPAIADFQISGSSGAILQAADITAFDEPWAMTFLPTGTLLVTTKPGKLFHVTQAGEKTEVDGMWDVAYGGQGGLGDVVPHPDYANNGYIYISNAERSGGRSARAVVTRVTLDLSGERPMLTDHTRIWTQEPKVSGRGHYSHRIAFGPDGKLFITSGDRQKQTPAQDFDKSLGKIIRLNDDGSVPDDNPWQDQGALARTFWSIGHRNLLGIDFDSQGRLWTNEMGPRHGDELNLIVKGDNYGWPVVSWGDNYSGIPIPDHDTRPEFNAPEAYWVPSIAPSSLVIYSGELFSEWKGDAFIGGLVSQALIRVDIDGETAQEAERFEWGERVREVEQGPDGALWVLEDRDGGRLLKLTPKQPS